MQALFSFQQLSTLAVALLAFPAPIVMLPLSARSLVTAPALGLGAWRDTLVNAPLKAAALKAS